jgi:hypothetical protein
VPGARGLLRNMSHGRVLLQVSHEERRLSEEDLQVGQQQVPFRLSILGQCTVGVIVRNIVPFADVCLEGIASHILMQDESYSVLPVNYQSFVAALLKNALSWTGRTRITFAKSGSEIPNSFTVMRLFKYF